MDTFRRGGKEKKENGNLIRVGLLFCLVDDGSTFKIVDLDQSGKEEYRCY